MTHSAFQGPLVSFGQGWQQDYNPEAAPSFFFEGTAIMDPRPAYAFKGNAMSGGAVYGFGTTSHVNTVMGVPSTLAVNNIAASQTAVSGTAMTLVSSTAAGITVGVSITRADTGAVVTGLLGIDYVATSYTTFGQGGDGAGGPFRLWNPAAMMARAVRIVSGGNDSAGTYTIRGYDVYGFPMTETITGANAGTATGTKAWKYIASITPGGTITGTTVTVGTTDVFGLPLRADYVSETEINMASTWITASTGFVAAVTTSPATATTGDVRGTYALQTASDGTRRLAIYQTPLITNIGSVTGLFGVTQV